MAAAAPREGFLEVEYSDAGFCNGGRHEGIPALRHGHAFKLEVFCVDLVSELEQHYADRLDRLRFIKVDAEGYDLHVLRALSRILQKHRPIVKAEVFKKTGRAYRQELLTLLEGFGYDVFRIVAEPVEPGPRLTVADLEERRHYDVLCVPQA